VCHTRRRAASVASRQRRARRDRPPPAWASRSGRRRRTRQVDRVGSEQEESWSRAWRDGISGEVRHSRSGVVASPRGVAALPSTRPSSGDEGTAHGVRLHRHRGAIAGCGRGSDPVPERRRAGTAVAADHLDSDDRSTLCFVRIRTKQNAALRAACSLSTSHSRSRPPGREALLACPLPVARPTRRP
jgi:hypothetical protein